MQTKPGGVFFCALYAGGNLFDSAYAWAEGDSADDAVHAARDKLWNGL